MTAPDVLQGALRFDGVTISPELDNERLGTQLARVKALMLDHQWRTLGEIKAGIEERAPHLHGASEAAVSARLRDLRKARFGGYVVERRRCRLVGGLWEYRVSFQSQDSA